VTGRAGRSRPASRCRAGAFPGTPESGARPMCWQESAALQYTSSWVSDQVPRLGGAEELEPMQENPAASPSGPPPSRPPVPRAPGCRPRRPAVPAAGDRGDGRHAAGGRDVDRQDRPGPRSDPRLDGPGIHETGRRSTSVKDGDGAGMEDAGRGGAPGVGRGDDLVPRADLEPDQRHLERRVAGGDHHAVRNLLPAGDGLLGFLDDRVVLAEADGHPFFQKTHRRAIARFEKAGMRIGRHGPQPRARRGARALEAFIRIRSRKFAGSSLRSPPVSSAGKTGSPRWRGGSGPA
jgi:hypothetical protein